VVRQARPFAIFLYFLPDFLKVTKERSRVFDIAVRGAFAFSSSSSSSFACHAPFTV
jgi:hypothetical protein